MPPRSRSASASDSSPSSEPKPTSPPPGLFLEADPTDLPPPPSSNPDLSHDPSDSAGESDAPSAERDRGRRGSGAGRGIDRRGLQNGLTAAVRVTGGAFHRFLTTSEVERDADLWIPDDEDERNISEPAARMLARRDITGGNPDVIDVVMLCIGVAVYVGKQLQMRRALRAQATPTPPDVITDEGQSS